MDPGLTFLAAVAFAAVHVFGQRLMRLSEKPRSTWLSAAGGVSVTYVFVFLLPEVAEHQDRIRSALDANGAPLAAFERHAYLAALAGLVSFYGLERIAKGDRGRSAPEAGPSAAAAHLFWLHLGAYGLYNILLGYLLVQRQDQGPRGLAAYTLAIGLHFVVNDRALRSLHGAAYHQVGRWLLAAAPIAGWSLGLVAPASGATVGTLFAFLAGAIVLNVLKEELPEERESRFSAFLAGAAAYAAVVLLLG